MLLAEHLQKQGVRPDIAEVIHFFAGSAKKIRAAFLEQQGLAGSENVYGEKQMALDKWADDFFVRGLVEKKLVKEIASEERENLVSVDGAKSSLALSLDPLDGSSCIETNLAVGTIVGLHHGSALKRGREMVAAFYLLYGPLTTLVYCCGNGVHEFAQNANGDFVLRKENLQLGSKKLFGPGGAETEWTEGHKKFISALYAQGYKIRFSGSFVADFNQFLHYGGVFAYPGLREKPEGKLRLLFEGAPMAFIAGHAGGASTDGRQSLLEVLPTQLSQRTPLYVGGKKEIALVETCFRE